MHPERLCKHPNALPFAALFTGLVRMTQRGKEAEAALLRRAAGSRGRRSRALVKGISSEAVLAHNSSAGAAARQRGRSRRHGRFYPHPLRLHCRPRHRLTRAGEG
jgi:hypothetical protein